MPISLPVAGALVPVAAAAPRSAGAVAYCAELQHIADLAMTENDLPPSPAKPRARRLSRHHRAAAGWKELLALRHEHLYLQFGRGSRAPTTPSEAAQARLLQEIKACLGAGWSEADGRSSPSYVVLHSALRPVSITLSMDATDDKNVTSCT